MIRFILTFILLLSFLLNINGATVTWTGGTGNWNVSSNWSSNTIPTINDNVEIYSGTVTIPAGYSAFSERVYIDVLDSLLISPTASLTVSLSSSFTESAGIEVRGTLNNQGTINIEVTNGLTYAAGLRMWYHGTTTNSGTIIITESSGYGLNVDSGDFTNQSGGSIFITGTDDSAIHNDVNFINENNASIIISMPNNTNFWPVYGIENKDIFDNYGSIQISNTPSNGIYCTLDYTFHNRSTGTITINNSDGLSLGSSGAFTNHSGSSLDFTNTEGLNNYGVFINEVNASITIDSTESAAIETGSSGVTTNHGNINISNGCLTSNIGAIYQSDSQSQFINESSGVININDIKEGQGIEVKNGNFTNHGNITIDDIEDSLYGHGIGNQDVFVNSSSGTIQINNVASKGIYNEDSFTNQGVLNIGTNIQDHSIFNSTSSSFLNNPCGIVNVQTKLYNNGSFENQGWFSTISNTVNNNSGTFTNDGVIEDVNNSFNGVSGITNDRIFVSPLNTSPCNGIVISNALNLGSLTGFTVNGWYTNPAGSISAGTYDAVNNEFTPNVTGEGSTTLYVKITDNSGSCDDIFEIRFVGSAPTWYADNDSDGFGDPNVSTQSCSQPLDFVSNNADCDDSDPNEFPGQTWYKDQDGDLYSEGTTATNCERPTGYGLASEMSALSGDCDDTNNSINPGASEICDAVDNNCNGQIDEGNICPGSECSNAISIASFPYNYSGSTLYLGDDYEFGDGCSSNYIGGNDAVFTYTPSTNEILRFKLENTSTLTNYAHAIFIMDGCPDDPSTNCIYSENAGATSTNNLIYIQTAELSGGTTYYIVISSHPTYHQDFDFELRIVKPVGNVCENAELINSLPFSASKSTVLLGDDYEFGDGCNSNYIGGNDYVFEYTPSADQVARFQLNNTSTSANYAHAIFVLDGCPDDPSSNCVYSENAGASATNTSVYIETAVLQSNTTYYIVVASHPSYHQDFDFNLSIILPTGNICENAEIINSLPFIATNQTTYLAGDDYEFGDGCNSNYIGANDYVYSFTPSSNTSIDITLGNLSDTQTGIFLLDGCPSGSSTTCISEINTSSNNYTMFNQPVTAGTNYFIVISSHPSYTSYFNYDIGVTQASALPVELLNFEVKENIYQDVLLNWKTVNEIDFEYFEIERKRENEDWKTIGSTLAQGDVTPQTQFYQWTDHNAKDQMSAPKNYFYYRLKMVDLDGTFEYSSIVNVLLEKENNGNTPFKIFPNPTFTNRNIFIQAIVSGFEEEFILTINDQLGREVYRQEIDFSQNSILEIPTRQLLSHGMYFVQIKNRKKILQTERLIILID